MVKIGYKWDRINIMYINYAQQERWNSKWSGVVEVLI
jgi:hypothetical protein